ncbi:DNA-binding transcriptional activator of the SARP family [Lentzea fradiae]|uniref:DNA-binding transcriptional activator of the SARP family n=1 Tax=Lentzea fradiae TaxID=200378 RepID=A0A1G7MYM1_9PSEU|nr:BTAD domain-containing putative transcriptional regulator [Lentzea fradiae]SDF66777.1 DNA-binding transcriptional activator of the SARP family [Lentzea fradiae]
MAAEYRVLGPLEVLLDGVAVPVPAGRCRVLLAALLLRPNQVVPVAELVERVWDGTPPDRDRARSSLQTLVRRLRVALGAADCVRTAPGGYRASVLPDQLDLLRFRALTRAGDFAAAVALSRGPVLSDVKTGAVLGIEAEQVTEEWLEALQRRIDADLGAGAGPDLVAELRSLTTRYPYREPLWASLLLALAQSGQQAAALTAYRQVRDLLKSELGVGPGERLRAVHQRVLAGEVRGRGPVPRLLPTAMPRFVGRETALRELDSLMRGEDRTIATITGTAGVGKTMLALHWAHSVAGRFPDGQLHVDMRGFDRHREPMTASDVLTRFLTGLDVPPDRLPVEAGARSAMFRELVAGRRMLVVLDNVRDAGHVRLLLPERSPSLVLITSRDRLAEIPGAHRVELDALTAEEGRALLAGRLGDGRVDDAADDLVAWCGGLPLALAIVAARAAVEPDLPLAALVAELADERRRLDLLDTGDAATSVRTVFQWSYQRLSPAAARLFRLVGLHPGPDITVPAATSFAGEPAAAAVRELVGANLLREHVPGRYACHDLLRIYAAERAEADEPAEARGEAVQRMLDHYLHTLTHFDHVHNEDHRKLDDPPVPVAGVVAETFADRPAALEWLRAEQAVLRAVAGYADDHGHDRHTWQLTLFAADMVEQFGLWHDWVGHVDRASAAAARIGAVVQHIWLTFLTAVGHARLRRFDIALEWFERTDRLNDEIGLVAGRVRAQAGVAWVLTELGRFHEAIEVARKSLELQRGAADRTPERMRMALHQLAAVLVDAGEYEEALELAAEFDAQEGIGTTNGRALMVTEKVRAYVGLGRYELALAEAGQALQLARGTGSWIDTATVQDLRGDVHQGLGDVAEARRWWTEALETYEQHRHPNAEAVRAKLAALPGNR